MGLRKALLRDIGFPTLLKASAIWFGIFLVLTIIVNIVLSTPSLSAEILNYVRSNPMGAAELVARLITALINPFIGSGLLLFRDFIPISTYMIYILTFISDSALFTAFLFTLLTGLNLWGGVRRVMGSRNYIAIVGSAISMVGSIMAFLGFMLIMLINVTPVVNQAMRLVVTNVDISMSIPIPWPITLGMLLWIVGIAVLGMAFLLKFIRARDTLGIASTAMLVITPFLVMVPLLCFGLMMVSSAIIVLSNRGVAV